MVLKQYLERKQYRRLRYVGQIRPARGSVLCKYIHSGSLRNTADAKETA